MSVLAEVFLESPDIVLGPTLRRMPGVRLDFERGSVADPNRPPLYVWIDADEGAAFEKIAGEDETVEEIECIEAAGGRRLYRMFHSEEANTLYPIYAELGGALLGGHAIDAGWQLQFRFADREGLIAFRNTCEELGITFHLEHLAQPGEASGSNRFGLTDAQRETLLVAQREGYFDVPRGISQEELASTLGISKSALSQRLRRGTSELIAHTLAIEQEGPA